MILVDACKGTVFSARIIKLIYEICGFFVPLQSR